MENERWGTGCSDEIKKKSILVYRYQFLVLEESCVILRL